MYISTMLAYTSKVDSHKQLMHVKYPQLFKIIVQPNTSGH